MNKIFFSFLIVLLVLLGGCSFDNKTGIWKGGEDEKIRITELETKQKQLIDIEQVYSSENVYKKHRVTYLKFIDFILFQIRSGCTLLKSVLRLFD